MKKQWQRPVLKTLKAGSAESGGTASNQDNGTSPQPKFNS